MAVVNDYNCLAHGIFESRTGKCPHGCAKAMVQIVHLKAPGYVTGRTQGIDRTLAGLAKDHGLTNMNNHGGETGAFIQDPNMNKAADNMQAQMQRGQTFSGAFGKDSVSSSLAKIGVQGENAMNNDTVRSMIQPPKPIVMGSYNPKDNK